MRKWHLWSLNTHILFEYLGLYGEELMLAILFKIIKLNRKTQMDFDDTNIEKQLLTMFCW